MPAFLSCPLHTVTGWYCPGCGTTRSVRALLHGNLAQAFAYNQMAFIVLPLVGYALGRSLWSWIWDLPDDRKGSLPARCGWLLVGGMVLYAVLRNLPYYPFTLLAPHDLSTTL